MAFFSVEPYHVSSSDSNVDTLLTEASMLGIPPGTVPQILYTSLGNMEPFVLRKADIHVFEYAQRLSALLLIVFND